MRDIKVGRIQLPDFQRDWVWDDNHVRRLLASISLAYPVGAVMMLQQGSVDRITGEEINDVVYFDEQIDSHHIFPVAWCCKQGIDSKMYNCLVNRTPLSAKTNKRIGSKAPSAYLKEFEQQGTAVANLDEILRSQCIELNILQCDDFEMFFQARAKALMELIGKAMGKNLSFESIRSSDEKYLEINS